MAEATSPTSPAASAAAPEDSAAPGFMAAAAEETAVAAGDATPRRDRSDRIVKLVSALSPEQRTKVTRKADDTVLAELREERKALAKQRADVSKRMRAEQKQKSRLLEKAQRLSSNELLEVFAMRMKRNEARSSSSTAPEQQGERP